jgi:hypothetical protein
VYIGSLVELPWSKFSCWIGFRHRKQGVKKVWSTRNDEDMCSLSWKDVLLVQFKLFSMDVSSRSFQYCHIIKSEMKLKNKISFLNGISLHDFRDITIN